MTEWTILWEARALFLDGLLATLGLFFGITVLMLVLTYLERSLSEPARAPERPVTGRQRAESPVH